MAEPRTIRLVGPSQRAYAKARIDDAPDGHLVEFREPTRSNLQNRKMRAMLADIARQKPLGREHTPDDWKVILLHEINTEMHFQFDLSGRPFPMGYRTRGLTVAEMSDFIEYLYKFGAENDIVWRDDMELAA